MENHEKSGLLSPFLMRKRLERVEKKVPAGSLVVDIGCGAGYLGERLAGKAEYIGVDRITPAKPRIDSNQILIQDLFEMDAFERIVSKVGKKADVVAALAFVEHISDVSYFLKRASSLLGEDGIIVGTTPHPIGRRLHDILAKLRICSPEAADEHERFLDEATLIRVGKDAGLRLIHYERFLFGLNQLFVYTRSN